MKIAKKIVDQMYTTKYHRNYLNSNLNWYKHMEHLSKKYPAYAFP